jgi:hypothetical protein
MRQLLAVTALLACGCATERPAQAESAAVYEAFLDRNELFWAERVLLQEEEYAVTLGMVSDDMDGSGPGIPRNYLPEVRQALEDLVARGRRPRRLPSEVTVSGADRRISRDSVQAIFRTARAGALRRLADSVAVVQLSAVGFSRDRSVAVVYGNSVCGYLCGGATVRVVRKHPGGWVAAEELVYVVY